MSKTFLTSEFHNFEELKAFLSCENSSYAKFILTKILSNRKQNLTSLFTFFTVFIRS